MHINFYKFQGTGNDFIILDNTENNYDQLSIKQVKALCERHFGIGADGLMMLENSDEADFEMTYFNADGKSGSLCGNGSRCIVKFAEMMGILKDVYTFKAADGLHSAEISPDGIIKLKMNDVHHVEGFADHYRINTGSPHYIKRVTGLRNMNVSSLGKAVRNSSPFEKEGINVNYVETIGEDEIYVRTYERGVEDETLSCGTGVTASALISAHNDSGFSRVQVLTRGGKLNVEFDKIDDNHFTNIWLSGPAEMVYKGQIDL